MNTKYLSQLMAGQRVFRSIAIPTQAFDALQKLKRRYDLATNNEVISLALIETEAGTLPSNAEPQCHTEIRS